MREIEFRGKHVNCSDMGLDNPIWVYGYLSAENYINSKKYECEMLVDKETVGQYTGFNDKKGLKIYEGDILDISEYPFESKGVKNYFGIVMWCSHSLSFYIYTQKYKDSHVSGIADGNDYNFYDLEPNQIKVIGNIYDNKELLEKGE